MSEGIAPPEILDDPNQLEDAPRVRHGLPVARAFAERRAGEHPLELTYKSLTINRSDLISKIMENKSEIKGLERDKNVKKYKLKIENGRLLQDMLRDIEIKIQETNMQIQKKMEPGGISAPGVKKGFVRLNQPCNERDYDSKLKIHSEKDKLDLVCSKTAGGDGTYRYRHVGNPGDPNIEGIDVISGEMIEAMRKNENFSTRGMATMEEFPPDVNQKARNIAIRAYEGDVSLSDRKWINSGSRFSGNVTSRGEPFQGPISKLGPDGKPMDGLLKRDQMKKIYADGGIARKFIHRRALKDEKTRDTLRTAEFYRSIQGLDLPEGDEEDDEPMPQYNKQVVTDEMVEGWDPETKNFNDLTPEEEKQTFIESLNFKSLKELKQLAESLNVEQIPDEIDELRELIKRKKYSYPESGGTKATEHEDEDEYEDEDAFGGGGKSKKRRKSKKSKSKRRKSKRRKTRRKKR